MSTNDQNVSNRSVFETYFGRHLQSMYAGIEATLKKETLLSCALLLSTYTEVFGGLVTGKLKSNRDSGKNYAKFLEYLGPYYVDLHDKYDLYKWVRSKLVHEFSPRPSYVIWLTESTTKKPGIEITDGTLNFNLREYYRDFKNGIDKYLKQFDSNKSTLINSIVALKINFDETRIKPRS